MTAALSVLVVDDDPTQRRLVCRTLSDTGAGAVYAAADAAEAMDALGGEAGDVDLVVCDLDMPSIDGIEFLHLLADRRPASRVMILSAAQPDILRAAELIARERGLVVIDSVAKPLTIETSRNCLKRVAEGKAPAAKSQRYSPEEIAGAIENGRIEPAFQPVVDLRTGRVRGAEALARWAHGDREVLEAGAFIGVLEGHALMERLTWEMLSRAVAWRARWGEAGLDIPVRVNLPLGAFRDSRIAARLLSLVRSHRLEPRHLIVEITETTAMTALASCLETLARIRMSGFGLSIDNYGMGLSSPQRLALMPITELKFDRRFMRDAQRLPRLFTLLRGAVGMCREFRLRTIGAGVESETDRHCLLDAGCELGQGFLLGRPLSGESFMHWAR